MHAKQSNERGRDWSVASEALPLLTLHYLSLLPCRDRDWLGILKLGPAHCQENPNPEREKKSYRSIMRSPNEGGVSMYESFILALDVSRHYISPSFSLLSECRTKIRQDRWLFLLAIHSSSFSRELTRGENGKKDSWV